jgi:hypothetical protein
MDTGLKNSEIFNCIAHEVSFLRTMPEFSDFVKNKRLKNQEHEARSWITINNSFLLREGKGTRKSSFYLSLRYDQLLLDAMPDLFIATGKSQYNDFNFISDPKDINIRPLDLSFISEQLDRFGFISYVLIGKLGPIEQIQYLILDKIFLVLDSEFAREIALDQDGNIRVNHIPTTKVLKEFCEANLKSALPENLDQFENSIDSIILKMEAESYRKVKIPEKLEELSSTNCIVAKLRNGFEEALKNYKSSIAQWKSAKRQESYNDMLRIAYNFADEIETFNNILKKICDLKPLINLMTFAHQISLSNTFNGIKLSSTSKKASLNGYRDLISQARNATFHHLVPIDTRVEVDFGDYVLQPTRLVLFDEFGSKSNKGLNYEDKELCELLQSFSHSRERSYEITFWDENISIMEAAIALITQFEKALNIVFRQRHTK